jgi:hypothetical protein
MEGARNAATATAIAGRISSSKRWESGTQERSISQLADPYAFN